MRELKFRAWCKDNMEMAYAHERSGCSDYYFDFRDNCFQLMMPVDGDYPAKVDSIIMQYTGLKDKNGKDIYEGDILTHKTDKNMIVVFNDKFASFGLTKIGWMHIHFFGEAISDSLECEVVGNIYENPELLTL